METISTIFLDAGDSAGFALLKDTRILGGSGDLVSR